MKQVVRETRTTAGIMKQVVRETRTTAGIKISFKERINKTQLASLTNNA